MNKSSIRVRFAPAPTGLMHLGNIRTALMNYLFAHQHNGTLVLRIEDTDTQRNFDPQAHQIMEDLSWLGLLHHEGPGKQEMYGPYFQSQRTAIYQKHLNTMIDKQQVYRCFCSPGELEKKRQRQIALKQPPRYDRTCAQLSETVAAQKATSAPYVWRAKLDQNKSVSINDLARGAVTFELHNFSDPVLTREDGTFTFLFANFVDDLDMRITHIFRGEDHLSNTAVQAALFQDFGAAVPTYWHMPILCNIEGKKLSKRDFGFSLGDLRAAGYLPEAICNYLAIIGGGTFTQEIMSLPELAQMVHFDHIHATGQVKYDVEKLNWMNHEWIKKLDTQTLTDRCEPFIRARHPQVDALPVTQLQRMIEIIKPNIHTLIESAELLDFYFKRPALNRIELEQLFGTDYTALQTLVRAYQDMTGQSDFVEKLKIAAKQHTIPLKQLFAFVRIALTGKASGLSIHELVEILGTQEATKRLSAIT